MSSEQYTTAELDTLLAGALDQRLDDAQMARFEQLLSEPQVAEYYVDHAILHAMLKWEHAQPLDEAIDPPLPELLPTTAVQSLAEHSIPISPVPNILSTAFHGTIGYFSQEIPFSLLIATVLTSVGLWIASLVYVSTSDQLARDSSLKEQPSFDPTLEVVGRITGMFDCRWSRDGRAPSGYDNVLTGRQFKLDSGLLEITYETGAKVILQGPVTYEVDSRDGGFLSIGKLTARLEKKRSEAASHDSEIIDHKSSLSTIHHPLFTIKTPTATVTDLGTEFGVAVDRLGTTTSHVFCGSVCLQMVSSDGKAKGNARVLHKNESAQVGKNPGNRGDQRITLLSSATKLIDFVREIPQPIVKTLDLVDVVAGGEGFSGRRGEGIDPNTGIPTRVPPKEFSFGGDGKYHRVQGRPLIDGVFMPNDQNGPMQVSSAGHTFGEFGTSQNLTYGYIWAGGTIPTGWSRPFRTVINGIDYASSGHGILAIHANKGITFDLEAIRHTNPGCRPIRFRAVTANTETFSLDPADHRDKRISTTHFADVWVLVDGRTRFRQRQLNGCNAGCAIVVLLCKEDRFLTLVGSDSGNGIEADWIMFGDPRVELLVADPSDSVPSPKNHRRQL